MVTILPIMILRFYSHAPRGARLPHPISPVFPALFLLTRPSRGATKYNRECKIKVKVSTHTPLAGRDRKSDRGNIRKISFYSHAPRGARLACIAERFRKGEFLLTRPSRGATGHLRRCAKHTKGFYSHAPRGARPPDSVPVA